MTVHVSPPEDDDNKYLPANYNIMINSVDNLADQSPRTHVKFY